MLACAHFVLVSKFVHGFIPVVRIRTKNLNIERTFEKTEKPVFQGGIRIAKGHPNIHRLFAETSLHLKSLFMFWMAPHHAAA